MSNFTTWRSLVDGEEISAIPDLGLYLDDWEDDKLSNRDLFSDTALSPAELEPTQSEFESPIRPEWTVDVGSPQATNTQLELDSDSALRADFTENITQNSLTWEFDWNHQDSNSRFIGQMFAETSSIHTNPRYYETGYFVQIDNQNNRYRLTKDSSGSPSSIITDDGSHSDSGTCKVTRDENGNWELFKDGDSVGTATDTSHTNPEYVAFSTEDGGTDVDNYRVF